MVDDKTIKIKRLDETQVYPELSRLNELTDNKLPEQPQQNKWSRRKKTAIIAGGVVFSLLLVFFMAAYYHDEQVIKEQQQIHQKELAAAQQEKQALEKKAAAKESAVKILEVKEKAENYLQDVNIPQKEQVTIAVNEAEKHVEKAVTAAKGVQSDPKVQAAIKDNAKLINQVTEFLQEQKQKLLALFNKAQKGPSQ